MNLNKTMMTAAVAVLTLAGAACSKSGQLSVSAKAETAAGADAGSGGSLSLGASTVTDVQFVVKRISLHGLENEDQASADGGSSSSSSSSSSSQGLAASGSAADQGGGSGSGGSGEGEIEKESEGDEVKVGPFLVDLNGSALAQSTLTDVFDASGIPAGTYREIKIVVAPDTSVAADGSSITITGTFNGAGGSKDFKFQSSLHAAQKIESPVTIGSGSQNVTLTIDPSGWFKDSANADLDPSDPANQSQIEDNIRKSIKGFCDHDRDGQDDASEHQGSGGSNHG